MEPDPVLAANTRGWLLRSQEDLENARHDLTAKQPFVRDALFHCQLEELGELCTRLDGTLASVVARVTPLTEFAARFRYPGAPWEPTLREARESIDVAGAFVQAILNLLPAGVAEFDDGAGDSTRPGS